MDERAGAASNEVIVDSLTLNDLEGTDLFQQLERIRQAHGGAPLHVGVVGVWTEARVSFLLYDLKTRLGIDELATCSALTASDSRAQHFNALSQLEKILGVRCFESLAEFVGWLRPGTELDLPRQPVGMEPRLRGDVRICHFRGALRLSPPWRSRAQPSGTGVTPPRRELSGPGRSALAPLTPPPRRLRPRADGGRRRRRPARRGARRSGATPTGGEGAGS